MPYEDDPLPRRPDPVIPRRVPAWSPPSRETLRRVADALRALPAPPPASPTPRGYGRELAAMLRVLGHEYRKAAPYEPRHGPQRPDAAERE